MKKFSVLTLVSLLVLASGNASANLLTNGSFEDPIGGNASNQHKVVPTGWYDASADPLTSSWWIVDSQWDGPPWNVVGVVPDGAQFLQGDAANGGTMDLAQAMILTPGLTYSVSLFYGGTAIGDTTGILIEDMVGGSPVTIVNNSYAQTTTYQPYEPAAFTPVAFNFTVSAGATSTILHVQARGGYHWVDDIQVNVVPEPATFALLSVGAILFRRKKRSC